MNTLPFFAAFAILFLVSCKEEPEEEFVSNEEKMELPFLMPVEDVFMIEGRGVTVTGRIDRGIVSVGDVIEIVGILETKAATVTGVEMFREVKESGKAGENVGLLLSGVTKDDLQRGMVLAKTGYVSAHTKFEAEVELLTLDEGGRPSPIFDGYRPQFNFWTTDVTGTVAFPEGLESVKPGDSATLNVELNTPSAIEVGQKFAVREGGRTVGSGVVTSIAGE